jgi:PKD repeat protein/FtsP/CotA-like multicopper oxidase with cupredoxin domain
MENQVNDLMKWSGHPEKERVAARTNTRILLTVCIVFTLFLLTCGIVSADNITEENATPSSDLNSSVTTALPAIADTPAIPTSGDPVTSASAQEVTVTTVIPTITDPLTTVPAASAAGSAITATPENVPTGYDPVLEQAFVDRKIMRMRNITAADRAAAAERAAAKGLVVGNAVNGGSGSNGGFTSATNLTPYPGGIPDYWGPYPNYANSQLPTVNASGYAAPGTGIRKFVDSLPGLTPSGANNLGKYIPVAVADQVSYPGGGGTPAADYYEIGLVQYVEKMHSDLPETTLRGYVQLETPVNLGTSKHVPLYYPNGSQILDGVGSPVFGYENPHYLGPLIVATQDRPVRVKFHNYLPTGSDGNLFIPVDTTIMGAGLGPLGLNTSGMPYEYSQNRATLHLHGGNTPWISDGTPHQWTTPAGENTAYPEGVSVYNVPDMDSGNEPPGTLTFYYTNQQSARLMFYHDHALGITRLNVYAGEAAGYLVRDTQEQNMITSGAIPTSEIPLIIQDRTFIPSGPQMAAEDPTWNWGGNKTRAWPNTGDLWFPHVYMTNQNPWDLTGTNAMGRWDYGTWFWPPFTGLLNGPLPNPFASASAPWESPEIPGTPNPTTVPEGFMDTPIVNGQAYPYVVLGPHAYRFRILNACNDRYLNLQLYYAGSNDTMWNGKILLNGTSGEVPMVPAVPGAGLPPTWPTDGRDGGAPNPNATGPAWIQIGTEGGFLPAPAVIPSQPVTYNYNRRSIVVLDVDNASLYLGPAERADVIVDFTGIPNGTKLILYNDAPAPNPAFDTRYDYYTNDPDQTLTGGAPTTLAGYGPNTRTIMQIQISNAAGLTDPTYVPGLINTALPAAYAASQEPPIIPQARYNTAFGANYPVDNYVRIQDTQKTFQPVNYLTPSTLEPPITMDLQPKSIIEDFDMEYGRMNAMLGVEVPRTNINIQTSIPYFYIDPPTEVFNNSIKGTQIGTLSDGTQIWKITHNGVDTHAVHWHMFNVQVINRVGWDGEVKPPYAYELGWKDTLKMRPLEDVIVAMRPITPDLPASWGQLPNSIRPLDASKPLGVATALQFHNIDPTNEPAPVINHLVNYGWEYVWHCHLLGHEEFDMMRAMAVAVAPEGAPAGLAAGNVSDALTPVTGNSTVFLAWTDNSNTETDWTVQRFNTSSGTWIDMARVPSYTGPQTGDSAMALVQISNTTADNLWRVLATNVVGDKTVYAAPANGYPTVAVNSTPSANVIPTEGDPVPGGLAIGSDITSGNAPLTVVFAGTASGPGATGWSWDFGDGDSTNATGIQNPVHTYMTNGVFDVNLTAMSIGGNATLTQVGMITVGPVAPGVAPVANFTALPLEGPAPLTVRFMDNSTNAKTWNWSFGDNWMANNINMSNSTLRNPTHTYLTAGNYTVTLDVTNPAGSDTAVRFEYIHVMNASEKIGVFRNGAWYVDYSGNGWWDGPVIDKLYYFGTTGNNSVTGDWNGNGKKKVGVFQNGAWYLDNNGNGWWDGPVIDRGYPAFGIPGDVPVAGDWNGDGLDKIGVFRNGAWFLDYNGSGWWDGPVIDRVYPAFGIAGDAPVTGDWNGDRTEKIGVFRNGVWYLDYNGNGWWDGPLIDRKYSAFGITGDIPFAGDWNNDGTEKIGVFRNGAWYLDYNGNGWWDGPVTDRKYPAFGTSGDKPVTGYW